LILQLAKHVPAKFQLSSFYPDGLRQIFDSFSSKIQNFLKKISKISISEKKNPKEHRKRQLLPKFKASSFFFTKISKVILNFFDS
jgi:hypothetical protein